MAYDDLFDTAMTYIPAEWRFAVVLGLFAALIYLAGQYFRPASPPARPMDVETLSGIMRVVGNQATTAAAIQRDLSAVREESRRVEAENDGLKGSIDKLERDVEQLIEHCRRMIRLVRQMDTTGAHETMIRETEILIDRIARKN